ncbi:MAG: hypothetical protein WAV09_03770 [Minisyncoccia bacterium]
MTLEKSGLPTTAEMIREQRENIRLKALQLRTKSEERLKELRGAEKELNQLEVLNVSERLVEIFSRLRVRRTEQNQDEEYDFHGEEVAWNQVKQGLKVAYDPLVFDAAEKVAEEYIRLSNIS